MTTPVMDPREDRFSAEIRKAFSARNAARQPRRASAPAPSKRRVPIGMIVFILAAIIFVVLMMVLSATYDPPPPGPYSGEF